MGSLGTAQQCQEIENASWFMDQVQNSSLLSSEDRTVYKIDAIDVDGKPEVQLIYLKGLVGERGFEPPTPWSRTWGKETNFVAIQSFEWCFNRLILAQSRHFEMNVSPRMAVPHGPGATGQGLFNGTV